METYLIKKVTERNSEGEIIEHYERCKETPQQGVFYPVGRKWDNDRQLKDALTLHIQKGDKIVLDSSVLNVVLEYEVRPDRYSQPVSMNKSLTSLISELNQKYNSKVRVTIAQ